MKILVTGAAGFIGSAVAEHLLSQGHTVVGLDNINDYYDPELKYARLRRLGFERPFEHAVLSTSSLCAESTFVRMDLCDKAELDALFEQQHFDKVVNLAAQAGVRYSITNPYAYLRSNLEGMLNILEACRNFGVSHLVYASSSSVYGLNKSIPYREEDKVDAPVSLYAATKKSDELMAHAYAKLYGLPVTGLRFFTVYGPWGRPDMAPMLFASAIMEDRPIKVFNGGDMKRDFTYVDDIVEGTCRVIHSTPGPDANGVPYKVYNIGCSNPVNLMDFIQEIEQASGKEAVKQFLPMQPGDVLATYADCSELERDMGYHPTTTLHEGIGHFMEWFKSYYEYK